MYKIDGGGVQKSHTMTAPFFKILVLVHIEINDIFVHIS